MTTKSTYKVMLDKMGGTQVTEYIGLPGEVFWNPEVGALRLSDGTTAGGSAITSGGGSGLQTRVTRTVTTSSMADGALLAVDITNAGKTYALMSVEVDQAAWVRLYVNDASRNATAETTRNQNTDPAPGAGVVAEAITTGAGTVLMSPAIVGFNSESTPTTTIPLNITNLSGSTNTITVTLTLVPLEA